jgi:hypothetical protein
MAAISGRSPAVKVEYDARGERRSKVFSNPYEARRFYTAKLKANANPAVKRVDQ